MDTSANDDAGLATAASSQACSSNIEMSIVMEDFENRYAALQYGHDHLQIQLEEERGKVLELNQKLIKLEELERQVETLTTEARITTEQINFLKNEKKLKDEIIEKKQVEVDNLRDELSNIDNSHTSLKRQLTELEIQNKLTTSEAAPLLQERQRLATELNSLKAHTKWLEEELNARSKEYQRLHRESQDRTTQLQLQLDRSINDKNSLSARLSVCDTVERQLQETVNKLSIENLKCKQESCTNKMNMELQLHEANRVISLQKEQILRWEQRYDDIIKENENMKETAKVAITLSQEERQSELRMMEQKFTTLLREQAEEFEKQRQGANVIEHAGQLAIATVAEIPDDQEGEETVPLGITDVYIELEKTKAALRRERMDKMNWQKQFQRVQEAIKEQLPKVLRQRQEYDVAVEQLSDFQNRLESALSERDYAYREATEARSMAGAVESRLMDKTEECQQLAQQVQSLLLNRTMQEYGAIHSPGIPTSIQEMQNQNQQLLSEHRRLMKKVEDLQDALQTNNLKNQLDAVTTKLNGLIKERDEQEILTQRITQQRDFYRALLAKHDTNILGSETEEISALNMVNLYAERSKKLEKLNTDLEGEIKSFQAKFQKAIHETNDMALRLNRHELLANDHKQALEKAERDLIASRSNEARWKSEATYHKEQCLRLEDSLDRARSEIIATSNDKNELQQINSDLQETISATSTARESLEKEKLLLENNIRLLETQLCFTKSEEKRLREENDQMRSEIARQTTLVESITRLEASISTNKRNENESLRKEHESEQRRLHESLVTSQLEIENMKARNKHLESSVATMQAKHDSLTMELQNCEREIVRLEVTLNKLKNKPGLLNSMDSKSDDPIVVDIVDKTKIEMLEAEIDALRLENEARNESVAKSTRLAKEFERRSLELKKLMDHMSAEKNKEIEELKKQLLTANNSFSSEEEQVKELRKELAKQTEEHMNTVTELKSNILSLETIIQCKEKDLEALKALDATADLEILRDEMKAVTANYELELDLHSQARAALRSATEDVDKESRLRIAAEEKLDEVSKEMEEKLKSLEEENLAMAETIELLEKRVKDGREQNTLLLRQLQKLTLNVDRSQRSRVLDAQNTEPIDVTESLDNELKVETGLHEIVELMQSENGILQKQLGTAKRVVEHEKAKSNVLQSRLDDVQAELTIVRSGTSGMSNDVTGNFEVKLRASEQQVESLRSSNNLLREEMEKLEHQFSRVQAELDGVKSVGPSQSIQRESEALISTLRAEKESVERELQSWKDRVKSLLSKFDQIDPEEHKRLVSELDDLKKEKESLLAWKKATEEESSRIRSIAKSLNLKNKEQKSLLESQQTDLEQYKSEKVAWDNAASAHTACVRELNEVKEKLSKIMTDFGLKSKELESATTRNNLLREKLREYQTMIRHNRAKEKSLTDELATAKAESIVPTNDQADVAVAAAEARAPDPPIHMQHTKETETIITSTGNEPQSAEESFPNVPTSGFRFRPSESLRSQAIDSQTTSLPSSLNPRASSFVLNPSSSASMSTTSKSENESGEIPVAGSNLVRNLSSAKREMLMKESLMAKKLKLQEALSKRKHEMQEPSTLISTSDENESDSKRAKTTTGADEVDDEKNRPPYSIGAGSVEVASENNVSEKASDDVEVSSTEHRKVEADQNADKETTTTRSSSPHPFFATSKPSETPPSSQRNPFGSVSDPPKSGPTIFGQSTSIAMGNDTSSTGFGGAFLDIKPPGSSSTPPTFTFGNSSSITLPLPSLPVPPNPFGVFNTSTSSFGSAAGATMPSMPLFGNTTIPPNDRDKQQGA